jgi:peptidoglycan/LPS O-acetylase OafA/YrhL
VLSGFLIGGILLDARASPSYFKTFYIRRSYRILPIYCVLLVFLLLGAYLTTAGELAGARQLFDGSIPWFAYATLTQNVWMALSGNFGALFMAVTWSLAIEEQFYLTLPVIIRFVRQTWLPYLFVWVIFAAPLFRILISFYNPPRGLAPYVLMPCRADALVLGVLAAFLLRQEKIWGFLVKNRYVMHTLLGMFLFGVFWLVFRGYRFKSWQMVWVGYTWLGLFYVSVLVTAVTQTGTLFSRCLRTRLLMWVGEIAYGLYLTHEIIAWLCHMLVPGGTAHTLMSETRVGIIALVLAILIARLSWTYFERPLLKRGRAYTY